MKRSPLLPLSYAIIVFLLTGAAPSVASGQADEREKNPLPRGLTPEEKKLLPSYVPPTSGAAIPPAHQVRAMGEFFDGAYVIADSLLPGRAYWVRSGTGGRLMLHTLR